MRRFWVRFRNLVGSSAEQEMAREMESHIALLQDDFVLRGLSQEEAVLAARRAYGSVAHARELHREARSFPWVEQFLKDVVYGIRLLLNNPGFAAVAVLSLALGIGANTVIFSLLNTTLLRPLDYQDPGQLVAIWTVPKGHPDQTRAANVSSYLQWRERATSFESMGSFFGFVSSLGREQNGAPAERIGGQYISSSLLATLGVAPELGRGFSEEEGAPVSFAPLAIISDQLWETRYGRDPQILGRSIELDGVKTTIVGVMPQGFSLFRDNTDYWAASGFTRQRLESSGALLDVVGRLKPGVSIKQAQAEMDRIAAQVSQQDPSRNAGNGVRVQPLQDAFLGRFRGPLLLLQGAVAFVLLIGCANVAGLLLARGAVRRSEIAVRAAIGAGRWRIVRQLLTESIVMALAGAVLGVALAWGGLRLFIWAAPSGFPRLNELRLDLPVLAFTALIALATGILFGLVPAIQVSRPGLLENLKATRGGGGGSLIRQRFRSTLVTLQIALALMLLIGAGLMINSFLRIEGNDLGMDPHGLLTFQFRYPALQVLKPVGQYRNNGLYDVNPNVAATVERMVRQLRRLPRATSVAAATGPPTGGTIAMNFHVVGGAAQSGSPPATARYLAITSDYFATLKTRILNGRDFTSRDDESAPRVAIVNEALAKLYWPEGSPLGRRIAIDYLPHDPPREIVAVVADAKLSRTQQAAEPMIYVPLAQQGPQWIGPQLAARAGAYFVLRTTADPMSLIPVVRASVAQIDPSQPIANIETVEATLSDQVEYTRLYVLLLGVFGSAAALLAAVGIYGVMSFSIAQRRREIGIRMALGAGQWAVLEFVARQALAMIGGGLLLGLAGSLALTRLLESALWNVKSTDPATFISVSLFLALIALIACIIPTRQAARVDPAVAVRAE